MNRQNCIQAFDSLGTFLSQFNGTDTSQNESSLNDRFYDRFLSAIHASKMYNGWFEEAQVYRAVTALSTWLNESDLNTWLSAYAWNDRPKTIAVIMAGNIPLVGFHDFASVLLSGNKILVKLSSEDKHLLPLIAEMLIHLNSEFANRIEFTTSKLEGFEAIIATGSDNSSRYFEHYFSKYPNVIRKNRNSVAVLSGEETKEELIALGDDIFAYYGLGCRNVSKVYVPKDYDFKDLFEALYEYKSVVDNKKYANNYDYYRALYLMGSNEMLENGFLLLKEDEAIASPIAMLHYEFYSDIDELQSEIQQKEEQIQCVVSNAPIANSFNLGGAQCPALTDYADGVDTLSFLSSL